MKSDAIKLPLGGSAWLRAQAAEKEEMAEAMPSELFEAEDKREVQGLRDAALRMERMEIALQSIMDESQKHFEHNPTSDTARLPMGYRKILNTAHHALNS